MICDIEKKKENNKKMVVNLWIKIYRKNKKCENKCKNEKISGNFGVIY